MSDYAVSQFWQYVKPGDYRTCDTCGVTQPTAAIDRVRASSESPPIDRCKDKKRCARWKKELGR